MNISWVDQQRTNVTCLHPHLPHCEKLKLKASVRAHRLSVVVVFRFAGAKEVEWLELQIMLRYLLRKIDEYASGMYECE